MEGGGGGDLGLQTQVVEAVVRVAYPREEEAHDAGQCERLRYQVGGVSTQQQNGHPVHHLEGVRRGSEGGQEGVRCRAQRRPRR
eukprot:532228-Prorocentrum_minimum.AAC.1